MDIANELMNLDNTTNTNNNIDLKFNPNSSLSKKEQFKLIIDKAKEDRKDKKLQREKTKIVVEHLDSLFPDLSTMLIKRRRDFTPGADEYDRQVN